MLAKHSEPLSDKETISFIKHATNIFCDECILKWRSDYYQDMDSNFKNEMANHWIANKSRAIDLLNILKSMEKEGILHANK